MASKDRGQRFENGDYHRVGIGISTGAVKAQQASVTGFIAKVFFLLCVLSAVGMVLMAGAM